METYCANCGKKIRRTPKQVVATRFCSEDCKIKFNIRFQADLSVIKYKKCAWCGDNFLPTNESNIYCSKNCSRLAINKRARDKRAAEKKELETLNKEIYGERKEPTVSVEQLAREADDCGLSYGKYKVQRFTYGKTYEELKAAYESGR